MVLDFCSKRWVTVTKNKTESMEDISETNWAPGKYRKVFSYFQYLSWPSSWGNRQTDTTGQHVETQTIKISLQTYSQMASESEDTSIQLYFIFHTVYSAPTFIRNLQIYIHAPWYSRFQTWLSPSNDCKPASVRTQGFLRDLNGLFLADF